MKKIFLFAIALAGLALISQAQVKMPAPSPTQTVKQDFAIGQITLTYSRPAAKGRKIFGDLVPFDKLWRLGANAATRIVFSDPVEIGGKKIDSGTYVMYAVPNIDSWEIILNKGLNNWGIDGYKETEDVARFRVSPKKSRHRAESFAMEFSNVMPESCTLDIKWDKTMVSIPIVADIRNKISMQIESALKGEKKPHWQAAQFYYEYEKNLPKALEHATKAIESNDKAFWMWIYKAKIQKDMGDKAGAMASSKKSLELATEAKNDDYIKMNKDLQKTLK